MASAPATAFREALAEEVDANYAELIDNVRGAGPEYREMNRALMLADRAAREWAATAYAEGSGGAPTALDDLDQLAHPEDGSQALQPLAQQLRQASASDESRALAESLADLAEALNDLDTERTNEGNDTAFRAVGAAAAATLVRASHFLGDEDFVVAQANETLTDLVAVSGWKNQLGPRFE